MNNETPFEEKTLCVISLLSWIAGNALVFVKDKHIYPVVGFFLILAYVCVIVALARYSASKFAKILLGIYVTEIVIVFVAMIVQIIYGIYMIVSCIYSCYNYGCPD